ncbi:VUT family protein [Burkholderia alba]|uniref:VUT family protein n=1 Tax=Burkholderia alba TaxID=2683677 RepID=UPI002B060F4B|nr:VUT family protein [Burkholderia alba]
MVYKSDPIMSIINDTPTCQIETILPKTSEASQSFARIRVNNTGVSLKIAISELLKENWIEKFSNEDVALLAYVNANDVNVKNVTGYRSAFPYAIIYLSSLFSVMLVVANLLGDNITTFKLSPFIGFDVAVPTALVLFPLTYGFGACITETYGFVVSRHVIWGAFLVNIVVVAVIMALAKAGFLAGSILGVSDQMARALVASATGYFVGELANSLVVSRLKIMLKGRMLVLRFIAANSVGAILDSVLFCTLLFYGRMPIDWIARLIAAQIFVKISYEVIFSILFGRVVVWIKSRDGVDYFDYKVFSGKTSA